MLVITTEDILINRYVNPPYRIKIDTRLEVYEGIGSENGHKGWIWVRLPDRKEGDTILRGDYMQLSPFQYRKAEPQTEAANSYYKEAA
jgi:hypothetical protein